MRTVVNVLGDVFGTCIVDHLVRAEVAAQDEDAVTTHYSSNSRRA